MSSVRTETSSSWLKLRKKLFAKTQMQVQLRLGEESPELALYRKKYEQDLSGRWQASNIKDLLESVKKSQFLFCGDFHALRQSQKAHIRILRALPKKRKIVLGLECIESRFQKTLDAFIGGEISEKEFLRTVEWQKTWGFPWEHYRPLFRWAQKNKFKVLALNSGSGKLRSKLSLRDRAAAEILHGSYKKNPLDLHVVIFGDLHVSSEHLPKELDRVDRKRSHLVKTLLFQNHEGIFFQALSKGYENLDLVKLSANQFCLLSTPPWVKWQDYLLFLEEAHDRKIKLKLKDQDDEAFDFTDNVADYVILLKEELGVPEVSLSGLSVQSFRSHHFLDSWKKKLGSSKWITVENQILSGQTFYLPEIGAGYLGRASVNHAASLAMKYIHCEVSKTSAMPALSSKDFCALIWHEAMAYFGSKLINHKRKTDTLLDLKTSLASKDSSNLSKEPLTLALNQKTRELILLSGGKKAIAMAKPRQKFSYALAAQLLGGILGEKLYAGYRSRRISPQWLAQGLSKDLMSPLFESIYLELLEVVESLPVAFVTKKEKL